MWYIPNKFPVRQHESHPAQHFPRPPPALTFDIISQTSTCKPISFERHASWITTHHPVLAKRDWCLHNL